MCREKGGGCHGVPCLASLSGCLHELRKTLNFPSNSFFALYPVAADTENEEVLVPYDNYVRCSSGSLLCV